MTRRHYLGIVAAAAALSLSQLPSHAQFNNGFNTVLPTGPRIFSPLGGGVFGNTLLTGQFANRFSANPFAGNVQSNISPFSGFAPVFVGNTSRFANVPRNIVFSGSGGTGSLNPVDFSGGNQLINDPISGFQQPRVIIDPFSGSTIAGAVGLGGNADSTMFFQNNNVNPFLVNGSINGNFGVNTLNTSATGFSPFFVNGANGVTFNTLNGGFAPAVPFNANQFTTQAFLNNRLAAQQQQRVFLARPTATSTGVTTQARTFGHVGSTNGTMSTSASTGIPVRDFPWAHPAPSPNPPRLYPQTVTGTGTIPVRDFPWAHPAPSPNPPVLYAQGGFGSSFSPINMNTGGVQAVGVLRGGTIVSGSSVFRPISGRNPVIGGPIVPFGSTGGTMVMGGRAR